MNINSAYQLINEKLTSWLKGFVHLLPNLALAAFIFVLGIYLAKLIRKIASKILSKFVSYDAVSRLFSSFIYVMVIAITSFSALSILKLDKAVTSLLAGAGILGIALAFAFQDIAANFIAGIVMSFTRPFEIGDLVKVKDYMGTVEAIRIRDSIIRTFQGQRVYIPNKEIFQNPIENFTQLKKRRMDIVVGVSYGDDLELVKRISIEAVSKLTMRIENEPVVLYFTEFGDSSINFSLRIWLNTASQPIYLEARSQAIMALKAAFDAQNITIPFPIRTLDFGIKGGERLFDSAVKLQGNDGKV